MATAKSKAKDIVIPKPERLSVDLSDEGLVEVTIKLRNREIVVSEADYTMDYQRGLLIGDVFEESDKEELAVDEAQKLTQKNVTDNLLINVWAPLAACSRGDVPDKEQFMKLASSDIDFWVETARELNPGWFEWITELQKAAKDILTEEEKKKKEPKSRSK